MEYNAETTINATPDAIWAILTDGASYPEWDPNMVRLDGTIRLGEKITAHTKLSDRAFPVTVSVFVPGQKMVWSGGMPLGLFKGVRSFTLTPRGHGETHVEVRERFSGLLLPLIGRTVPDLSDSFTAFVAGIKARAEGTSK